MFKWGTPKKCKEHEYGWRFCLRIKRLTKKTKNDANDVLNQVHDLFKVEISDAVLDNAHRISKVNNDVLVRFTTFRHRTLFYRNRKKLKNQSIHLSSLTEARKLIENNEDIAFSYADINCRCKLWFKNNDEYLFESLDVLKSKLSGYSNDSNEWICVANGHCFDFKSCFCYYH